MSERRGAPSGRGTPARAGPVVGLSSCRSSGAQVQDGPGSRGRRGGVVGAEAVEALTERVRREPWGWRGRRWRACLRFFIYGLSAMPPGLRTCLGATGGRPDPVLPVARPPAGPARSRAPARRPFPHPAMPSPRSPALRCHGPPVRSRPASRRRGAHETGVGAHPCRKAEGAGRRTGRPYSARALRRGAKNNLAGLAHSPADHADARISTRVATAPLGPVPWAARWKEATATGSPARGGRATAAAGVAVRPGRQPSAWAGRGGRCCAALADGLHAAARAARYDLGLPPGSAR
ncbi:hypothetical protein SGRIM128S_05530 [Streptomyces griseomycini]